MVNEQINVERRGFCVWLYRSTEPFKAIGSSLTYCHALRNSYEQCQIQTDPFPYSRFSLVHSLLTLVRILSIISSYFHILLIIYNHPYWFEVCLSFLCISIYFCLFTITHFYYLPDQRLFPLFSELYVKESEIWARQ